MTEIKDQTLIRLKKSQKLHIALLLIAVFLLVLTFFIFGMFGEENGDIPLWCNFLIYPSFVFYIVVIPIIPGYLIANKKAQVFVSQIEAKQVPIQTAYIDNFRGRKNFPDRILVDQAQLKDYPESREGILIAHKLKKMWPIRSRKFPLILNEDESYIYCSEDRFPSLNSMGENSPNKRFYVYSPKYQVVFSVLDKPGEFEVKKFGLLVKYKAKS